MDQPTDDSPDDDPVDLDRAVDLDAAAAPGRCDAAAHAIPFDDGTVGHIASMRSGWEQLRRRRPRELAILLGRTAAVRLWLDRTGSEPRVVLEDLERGAYVSLSAADVADLIRDREGPPDDELEG